MISRKLIDKGSTVENDISYVTASLTDNYNLPEIAPQKYEIVLDQKVINDNSYRYQFYDHVDKRLKYARIYSPFSHLKSGIIFKGKDNNVNNNTVFFQLTDDYSKIKCVFFQNHDEKSKITDRLYRDFNGKFVKEQLRNGTNRWWGTNPSITHLAQNYKNENNNSEFHVLGFMKELYLRRNLKSWFNGKYKVIENHSNRIFNGRTIPILQGNLNIEIKRNESFFVNGAPGKKENNLKSSILNNCTFIKTYTLTDQDKTAINQIYPNFSFNYLNEYQYQGNARRRFQFGEDDLSVFPSTKEHRANFKKTFLQFIYPKSKYEKYLTSNSGIFYFDS